MIIFNILLFVALLRGILHAIGNEVCENDEIWLNKNEFN
jgi:hypothetical protein